MANRRKPMVSERRAPARAAMLIAASVAAMIVVGTVVGSLRGTLGKVATAAPPLLMVETPIDPLPAVVSPVAVPAISPQVVTPVEDPDEEVLDPLAPTPATAPVKAKTEHRVPVPLDPEASPKTFDGRPLRVVKTLRMLVTAYSPDEKSCGKWAKFKTTASGVSVYTNDMHLVAADTSLLPFGTIISVPGYHDGKPVPVLDRGGAIKGHHIDLLYPTDGAARRWGARWLLVTVWEYADRK